MRFGIVVFPGTWSDGDCHHAITEAMGQEADYLWHKDTDLSPYDCVVLPGGFSYGDYLRTGAIARFSPVMGAVEEFARSGGAGDRDLQRVSDPVRGRTAARRADPQQPPSVPLPVDRSEGGEHGQPLFAGLRGGAGASHSHLPRRGQLL